jgi:hypothetical protein
MGEAGGEQVREAVREQVREIGGEQVREAIRVQSR